VEREVDKHRRGEAASKDEVEEEEETDGSSVVDETISLTDRPIEGKSGEENLCIPLFFCRLTTISIESQIQMFPRKETYNNRAIVESDRKRFV
jgi:hypothetical protein